MLLLVLLVVELLFVEVALLERVDVMPLLPSASMSPPSAAVSISPSKSNVAVLCVQLSITRPTQRVCH